MPLLIIDRGGRCVLANDAFRALVGGVPCPEQVIGAGPTELGRLCARAFAGETVHEPGRWYDGDELRLLAGDGHAARRLALELTLAPGPPGAGEDTLPAHVIVCLRDASHELALRREALARLQLVLDRMPIACILNDTDFRITYFNPAAERIFGFKSADVVGHHPFGRITPISVEPLVTEIFRRLAAGDMSANAVAENTTADGRTIVCEWLNTPLHEPDGTFIGIMSMAQDVTERRQAEEALRTSEERFRTLVSSLDDIVYTLDTELRCTGVHGRFWEQDGRVPAQYLGRLLSSLLRELPAAAHEEAHRRAAQGERIAYEWTDERPGPQRRHYHTSLSPLHDPNGQVTGIVGVCRDITGLKKVQAQLLVSDRMVSVGMLAAGVAHEINNPLAAVMANLDLIGREARRLERFVGPTELSDLLEELADAREASHRVRETVRDLKVFSQTQDDEERRPTELNPVVESVSRMAGNEIRHRAQLVKQLGDVPRVYANESRLSQVLLNLMLNAVQAIREGDANHQEIRLVTRPDPRGRAIVEVHDTGCGMPREVLARLFTPFFTTKPVGVGTGLGLSICHRIVAAMGGEIEVESEVGRGSCFRVILPAVTEAVAGTARAVLAAEPVAPPAPPRGRVLIIDDEPLIAAVVKRTLIHDHDVIAVASAEAALRLLVAGEDFDVILCDLMMPQMTGMDLHAELLTRLPAQAERLIFLTGGAFTPRAREFLSRTSCPHLEKPFEADTLRTMVDDRVRSGQRSVHTRNTQGGEP